MRVLSLCTGIGFLDRGFIDCGFDVIPGCEIDPDVREFHAALCGGGHPLVHDIKDLPTYLRENPSHYDGVIGGPPCQPFTKLASFRPSKHRDVTPEVIEILGLVRPAWFVMENVVPLTIDGASHVRLNAAHFAVPHQQRWRWFTYSPNLTPPTPYYQGGSEELVSYPTVVGKVYGLRRASILQGYPLAADLPFSKKKLTRAVAEAVHYQVALAWAKAVKMSCSTLTQV